MTRQIMHDAGEDIHIALWPKVHEMHQVASRQYAFEGRCYTVAVGAVVRVKDLPDEMELIDELHDQPEHLLLNGGSCIVRPDGMYELEPVFDKEQLIIHTIPNVRSGLTEHMTLDTSGHYHRKDVFSYQVNKDRR
jgi:hypothetical protein